jgi:hypothetical protein
MAINVNDNFKNRVNRPTDFRFGPFISVSQANSFIPIAQRYHGLIFGVYANPTDIANSDIIYYYYYNALTNTDVKLLLRPPVDGDYVDQETMISNQDTQLPQYVYFDGGLYWEYLGTTNGDITDYRLVSADKGHDIVDQNDNILPTQPKLKFNRMLVEDDNDNQQTLVTRPPSLITSPTPPNDPLEGDEWIDSVNWRTYVFYDGYWVEEGGNGVGGSGGPISSSFIGLIDTPNTYIGQAGKTPAVNNNENGLEFRDFTILAPNGVVTVGSATQSGNDITYGTTWQWRFNQVVYTLGTSTTLNFPSPSLGFIRTDLVVGNTLGQVIRVAGTVVADDQPSIAPNPPANTIPLQEVLVSNAGITSFTNFALATFVRFDIANQNLSLPQRQNARTNIQAVSRDVLDTKTEEIRFRWNTSVALPASGTNLIQILGNETNSSTAHVLRIRIGATTVDTLRIRNRGDVYFEGRQIGSAWEGYSFSNNNTLALTYGKTVNQDYDAGNNGSWKFWQPVTSAFRSPLNTGLTRRDELYLNYLQTITTPDIISDLAINEDTKLLRLTLATELTGVIPSTITNGRLLRIYNANTVNLTIKNQSTSSTTGNRFDIGADYIIPPTRFKSFIYIDSRWRIEA